MDSNSLVPAFEVNGWPSKLAAQHMPLFEAVRREALKTFLMAVPMGPRREQLQEMQDRIDRDLTRATGINSCSDVRTSDPEVSAHWEALDAEFAEFVRHQIAGLVIMRADEESQRRLRGLQWQIDRICKQAPNPLAAAIHLNELMMDSVLGEGGLNDVLHGRFVQHTESAKVLPF